MRLRFRQWSIAVALPGTAVPALVTALLVISLQILPAPAMAAPNHSIQQAPQPSVAAQAAPDDGEGPDDGTEVSADEPAGQIEGDGEPTAGKEAAPAVRSRIAPSPRGGARPAGAERAIGEQVIAIATQLLGAPYMWSGASPGGFDCSGLTWYVFKEAGFPIPRDLRGQLNAGRSVERADLQPGDLLIFENTYRPGLSHSGIYIGDNQFIDSQDEWTGVVVNTLESPNWGDHFAGASRPWEPR